MWRETYENVCTITNKLNELNEELLRSPAAAELREALSALEGEYPALRPQVALQFRFAADDSTGAEFRHEFGLEYVNALGFVPFELHYRIGPFSGANRPLFLALSELSLDHQRRDYAAQDAESEMEELRRTGRAPSDPHEQVALQKRIAEQRCREARERFECWRARIGTG